MKNIIILTSLFIGFNACSGEKGETPKESTAPESSIEKVSLTEVQLKQANLTIGTLQKKSLSAELKLNGVVDVPPQNMVSVSFPVGGYLKSTKLIPGMHVSRGELIAIMEDQSLIQLQQDYLMAKSKGEYLNQELDRQAILSENKVNAEKVYQQAVADFNNNQVLLKGLSEKLKLIGLNPDKLTIETISRSVPVLSPINGFVSKVNVNIGKFVNPSDVLFELINPDDIHVALTVFEKDIEKIRIGQKVKLNVADDPKNQYDGEVILVTRNLDENRSGVIHCHYEMKPKNLMPGMFINATLEVAATDLWSVPEDAVARFGNKEFIFESTGKGEFNMLEVKTGIRQKGFVELVGDPALWQDKQIVLHNAYTLLGKLKNTAE